MDFFPSDAIGGTNKASAARNPIKVIFSTGEAIEVDLPKDKKFLRARAPIRKFFKDSKAEPGDIVLISRIGKRQFKFDLVKS